ncbi:transposase [Streptomyces viridosporus ATCC 14672]|uniref:Transposase n=1 Tax=Streptomyces viridosporus (strain ATCC 14672 / DSM 40746 / JCM 4963 / KCTC 9882 / NRRL B-12104 / FH 1290) TaxID=566461 RepID=D5ZP13_STRV1|nr:transposase [Streptomyces viridosporus ATCC 14672]
MAPLPHPARTRRPRHQDRQARARNRTTRRVDPRRPVSTRMSHRTDEDVSEHESCRLPGRTDGRGRPWRDHRQVINGVLWRLRTGTPWRDVPDRYGPWQTIYERFARWETCGTWAKLLEHVQVHQDAAGTVNWTISVDSTIARAHQHASGARAARTPAGDEREDPAHPVGNDQALGRSRGGLTTKIHLACDGRGLPLTVVVTPGNVNDSIVFDTVMGALRVPRAGAGRPRCRPDAVIADKTSHADKRQAAAAVCPAEGCGKATASS